MKVERIGIDGPGGGPSVSRRQLLIGGALIAASATAFARTPRHHEAFLGSKKLEDLVPKQIGEWRFETSSGLVLPPQDQLRDAIYSQLMTRLYVNESGGGVMMLIAYSGSQDGVIQVHRPEVCYPASGFRLVENSAHAVPIGDGRAIPSRYIVAEAEIRSEQLIYWTRLGPAFPDNWFDQRMAVVNENLMGNIPDAVLVRLSTVGNGDRRAVLDSFAAALYAGVGPQMRRVLVGTGMA